MPTGHEIPEPLRKKTFNQGGPDPYVKGGWRYVCVCVYVCVYVCVCPCLCVGWGGRVSVYAQKFILPPQSILYTQYACV